MAASNRQPLTYPRRCAKLALAVNRTGRFEPAGAYLKTVLDEGLRVEKPLEQHLAGRHGHLSTREQDMLLYCDLHKPA